MKNKSKKIFTTKNKRVPARLCPICGESFYPLHKSDVTCGGCVSGCKSKKSNVVFLPLYQKCAFCGKEFIPDNYSTKYCSDKCRKDKFELTRVVPDYEVSKEEIFRRDDYKCIYCGKSSIEDGVKLHLEHIYPVSKGGREDLFNLATSCERCNTVKSARMLSEDVILRIWERNKKLNEKFESKTYDELMDAFGANLQVRRSRLI